jgi:hypothetical protein
VGSLRDSAQGQKAPDARRRSRPRRSAPAAAAQHNPFYVVSVRVCAIGPGSRSTLDTRAQVLQVDEFSDLLGDVFYRVLVSAETVAGAEERADGPNLVVGHPVRDGDQQVACQQFG